MVPPLHVGGYVTHHSRCPRHYLAAWQQHDVGSPAGVLAAAFKASNDAVAKYMAALNAHTAAYKEMGHLRKNAKEKPAAQVKVARLKDAKDAASARVSVQAAALQAAGVQAQAAAAGAPAAGAPVVGAQG